MNRSKRTSLIGFLLIVAILFIFTENRKNRIEKKYRVINLETEFNGTVKKFYLTAGGLYMDIDNAHYQMINTRNNEVKPKDADVFMRKGDKIYKLKGSEYIIICRNGAGYYFHIRESVDKEPGSCPPYSKIK